MQHFYHDHDYSDFISLVYIWRKNGGSQVSFGLVFNQAHKAVCLRPSHGNERKQEEDQRRDKLLENYVRRSVMSWNVRWSYYTKPPDYVVLLRSEDSGQWHWAGGRLTPRSPGPQQVYSWRRVSPWQGLRLLQGNRNFSNICYCF